MINERVFMSYNGNLLKTISPPTVNLVLSRISIIVGICYLIVIPVISERNYTILAALLWGIQTGLGVSGLLYFRNRKLEVYDGYIVYVSPLGKHISFIPFEAELIVIKPIGPRDNGGIVIRVKQLKLQVPDNYVNYSYLEEYMIRTAKHTVSKSGIM